MRFLAMWYEPTSIAELAEGASELRVNFEEPTGRRSAHYHACAVLLYGTVANRLVLGYTC